MWERQTTGVQEEEPSRLVPGNRHHGGMESVRQWKERQGTANNGWWTVERFRSTFPTWKEFDQAARLTQYPVPATCPLGPISASFKLVSKPGPASDLEPPNRAPDSRLSPGTELLPSPSVSAQCDGDAYKLLPTGPRNWANQNKTYYQRLQTCENSAEKSSWDQESSIRFLILISYLTVLSLFPFTL